MKKYLFIAVLCMVFIIVFHPDISAQCSQCKLLAEQGDNTIDDKILDYKSGNNINSAILYIMMAPYVLIGIAMLIFRKKIKKYFNKAV